MSLLALNSPKESLLSDTAYVGRSASFDEMVHLSFRNQAANFNADSSAFVKREVRNENAKLYEQLTGESLFSSWAGDKRAIRNSQARLELEDEAINKLKEQNPARYSVLKTSDEIDIEARSRATRAYSEFQEAWEYTPGFGKYAAGFAGGAGAVLTDPIQWPAMAVGSTYAVGSSVLRNFAIEAGAGALSEMVAQPSIMQWQAELGQAYGVKDAAINVVLGAAAGGLISLPLSAYSKVMNKNAMELRDIADKLEASDKLKAGIDNLADVAEHNAGSPSPDLARHTENAEVVNAATAQGRLVELDELNTRITDDIDGLPAEAFDFLDPDAEFKITTTKTGSDGKPSLKTATKKLSKMNKPEIRQVVEADLLPKMLDQIRDDYTTTARQVGKAQDKKIKDEIKKINSDLSEIKRNLKSDKNNQEYNKRKIELEENKLELEQKRNVLGLQKNRKKVMKDLAKGVVPKGDDYVATSVRKTIDKVVDAAVARKKVTKAKLDAVESSMKETGIIKPEPRPVDAVMDELLEAEKILDEEVGFQLSKLDESDLDENIFDRDGNITTMRKLMEETGADKAELDAIRSCSVGGVK